MKKQDGLVAWMQAKQAELGLSCRAFARKLGIAHTTLLRIYSREYGVTIARLASLKRLFPDEWATVVSIAFGEEKDV